MDEDKNQNKAISSLGQSQLPGPSALGTEPKPIFPPLPRPPVAQSSTPIIPQAVSRPPVLGGQTPPSVSIPQIPRLEMKPEPVQESKPLETISQKDLLSPSSLSSSIRTMQGDIQALIKGKAPSGEQLEKKFNIPPKAPVSVSPSPSLPPPLPRLSQQPQIKSPVVKLGELQKAKPLAPSSVFIPPPKISDKKEPQSLIVVPPGSSFSPVNNRSLVLYALLFGAILGGVYYIFFASKERTIPVFQGTPTPIISKSPLPTQSFVLNSSGNPFSQISIFIANQNISQGETKLFSIINELGDNYNFQKVAEKFSMILPSALLQNLSADKAYLFVYGQKEYFGDTLNGFIPPKRYGLVAEITSDVNLISNLANWENKISSDFEKIFEFKISDASAPDFVDNVYKNTNIRYRNFPSPDKTIDYAVVTDFRGKKYLVVANSREAIFNVIDNINKIFSNLKK